MKQGRGQAKMHGSGATDYLYKPMDINYLTLVKSGYLLKEDK